MAVVTEKFANNADDTLNGAILAAAVALTLHSGTKFPTTGNFRLLIGTELILVGSIAGAVCSNLTRGIENTVAANHADNAPVTHILTAGALAILPRSMAAAGDIEFLDSTGKPASLAAPADGTYNVVWTGGVPSYVLATSLSDLTGVVKMYAGAAAPSGYLICDGSAVSRTAFATLFAAIGTTFGPGNGATTFNIPDMRGRAPIGVGTGAGLTARTLAGTVGEETHLLVTGEMPSHSHIQQFSNHLVAGTTQPDLNSDAADGSLASGDSTATTGGGGAHNNMQPSIGMNFIIKT